MKRRPIYILRKVTDECYMHTGGGARCRNRNIDQMLWYCLYLGRIIVMAELQKTKAGFWPSPNCFVTVNINPRIGAFIWKQKR